MDFSNSDFFPPPWLSDSVLDLPFPFPIRDKRCQSGLNFPASGINLEILFFLGGENVDGDYAGEAEVRFNDVVNLFAS